MSIRSSGPRRGAVALALLSSAAAHAESPRAAAWGLGLAVAPESRPYRDIEQRPTALPLLMFENRRVRVLGPTLDLKLGSPQGPATGQPAAALRVRLGNEGYESKDSPSLAGMAERKAGVWLGGSAAWRLGAVTITGEVLADASSHSQGVRASLGLERAFPVGGRIEVTPRLVIHRLDRQVVDYYFGVRPEEALATRPRYRGEAATNVEAGLRVGTAIAPHQRLSLDVSSTRWGSSIRQSPLIDGARQHSVRVTFLQLF